MTEEVKFDIVSDPDPTHHTEEEGPETKAKRMRRFQIIHHAVPIVLALCSLLLWGVLLGVNDYGTNEFEAMEAETSTEETSTADSEHETTEEERPYFVDDEHFWNQSTWEPRYGLFRSYFEEESYSYLDTEDKMMMGT